MSAAAGRPVKKAPPKTVWSTRDDPPAVPLESLAVPMDPAKLPIPPIPRIWDPTGPKLKSGRPSLFEQRPDAWPRLIMALRDGNTFQASAVYAGMSRGVFNKMLRMGRQAKVGPWKDFMDAIEEAKAVAEVLHLGNIARAGRLGTWKASAFLLGVRDPARYAPPTRVAHSGPDFNGAAVFEMRLPSVKPPGEPAPDAGADTEDDEGGLE